MTLFDIPDTPHTSKNYTNPVGNHKNQQINSGAINLLGLGLLSGGSSPSLTDTAQAMREVPNRLAHIPNINECLEAVDQKQTITSPGLSVRSPVNKPYTQIDVSFTPSRSGSPGTPVNSLLSAPSTPIRLSSTPPKRPQGKLLTPQTNKKLRSENITPIKNKSVEPINPKSKVIRHSCVGFNSGFNEIGRGGISQVYHRAVDGCILKLPYDMNTRIEDSVADVKSQFGDRNIFDAIKAHANEVADQINAKKSGSMTPNVRLEVVPANLITVEARVGSLADFDKEDYDNASLDQNSATSRIKNIHMLAIKTRFCPGKHYATQQELQKDFNPNEANKITALLKEVYDIENNRITAAKLDKAEWLPILDWKPENILIQKQDDGIVVNLIDFGGDASTFAEQLSSNEPGPINIFEQNSTQWRSWGF